MNKEGERFNFFTWVFTLRAGLRFNMTVMDKGELAFMDYGRVQADSLLLCQVSAFWAWMCYYAACTAAA